MCEHVKTNLGDIIKYKNMRYVHCSHIVCRVVCEVVPKIIQNSKDPYK